jgi:hypothetical protein
LKNSQANNRLQKPARWGAIFCVAVLSAFSLVWCPEARSDQSVTLVWSPDTTGTVAGYAIYSGDALYSFSSRMDVGTNTSVTISNLPPGSTNYFAVSAYNTSHVESAPSDEIIYTVPGGGLQLVPAASIKSTGFMTMQFPATAGHQYEIQISPDLQTWTTAWQSPMVTANGMLAFKDHSPMTAASRFYRLVQH